MRHSPYRRLIKVPLFNKESGKLYIIQACFTWNCLQRDTNSDLYKEECRSLCDFFSYRLTLLLNLILHLTLWFLLPPFLKWIFLFIFSSILILNYISKHKKTCIIRWTIDSFTFPLWCLSRSITRPHPASQMLRFLVAFKTHTKSLFKPQRYVSRYFLVDTSDSDEVNT